MRAGTSAARWRGRQQPVHGRAMQLARADEARPLEHPDDPPDGAPGPLALDAQEVLGDLGGDRPAPAPVLAIPGEQGRKAPAAVGVVPGLDRARRELNPRAVRPLLRARRGLGEVPSAVPVLQPRTRERTEHAQPPQGHRLLVVVLHGLWCSCPLRPLLGGSSASPAAVPPGAAVGAAPLAVRTRRASPQRPRTPRPDPRTSPQAPARPRVRPRRPHRTPPAPGRETAPAEATAHATGAACAREPVASAASHTSLAPARPP